jgi:hypothetical protein
VHSKAVTQLQGLRNPHFATNVEQISNLADKVPHMMDNFILYKERKTAICARAQYIFKLAAALFFSGVAPCLCKVF